MKHLVAGAAALTLTGFAAGAIAQEGDDDLPPWNVPITYECERGALLDVVYLNTEDGGAYAVAQIDGHLVPLMIARSGSGAKFMQGEGGYVLWSKGEEATVYFGADEDAILSDCVALPQG